MTAATASTEQTSASTQGAKTIKPRRMAFDMSLLQEKNFYRGNPIISSLLYALSAVFPEGERFFIDSVRHYQSEIEDPELLAQIRGFIQQEGHHTRVHVEFNARAQALGIPMDRLLKRSKKRMAALRTRTDPGVQLAVTAAAEHITATLAHYLLQHQDIAERGENSPFREMIIWHAVEEIEHKAVAFDVYKSAVKSEKQRIAVAKLVFRDFFINIAVSQLIILWHNLWHNSPQNRTIPTLGQIREAWVFMWGEKGMRRWAAPEFKKYLRTGFHPNDIDQHAVIAHWQEDHPDVSALQVG